MKTKILTLVNLVFALLLITAVSTIDTSAQDGKDKKGKQKGGDIVLKSTRGAAERGKADANIKQDQAPNDAKMKMDKPAAKGGTTRGRGCRVDFDNRTAWAIKLFVDGSFRGVLGAYGDASVYVAGGDTSVYARADFTDGTFLYWGPKLYDCPGGNYIRFRMDE